MIKGHYSVKSDVIGAIEGIHVPGIDAKGNGRIKVFADGSRECMVCSRPIFGGGWEESNKSDISHKRPKSSEVKGDQVDIMRSMRRARARVHDIARSNEFSYFVTLTLDQSRIDRYDMAVIVKHLNDWLDNAVRRNGLAYVLVPERHKDGAIHFHGFFNDALVAVDSGHVDKHGHIVYNLPRWTWGFSTAIRLYGDYRSAVGYVCKYIGKQGDKPAGRWYYSGGKLKSPEVYAVTIDYNDIPADAYTFRVDEAAMTIWKWEES